MAGNKVFRKVSLERLSSPEELDQRLTVTSPIGWVACMAAFMLVLAGLIWGIWGSISDKAVGQGILISSGGITNVIHHTGGQVTDVRVQEGDYVEKGDVIARVEQTQLIEEINKLKEDLFIINNLDKEAPQITGDNLNLNIYGKLVQLALDIKHARTNLDVQKASFAMTLEQVQMELEKAELDFEEAQDKYENYKYLFDNNAISEQELKAVEHNYILSKSNLQTKKEKLLPQKQQVLQAEQNLASLVQHFNDTRVLLKQDLEKQIDVLQMHLVNNSEIVADVSGRVLELRASKGDLVNPGNSVCSIAREEKENETLEAVIYVPVEMGKKVLPGMEVNICPSTVKKEEDGFMLGNVKMVSEYPASAQGMMLTLGNAELVKRLSGQMGSPIEVRVELIKDNNTISGYRWSTPDGPEMIIDGGTVCIGEVKVKQQRPISMIIPFIKRVLPIY